MEIRDITEPYAIKQLAALAEEVWTEYYTPIIGAAQTAYMIKRFQSEEAITRQINEGYHYSAAYAEGIPAGYCATRYEPKHSRVFLSKLYVLKRFRRQGLAGALLAHNRNSLEAIPVQTVYLTVNKHNAESIAAYKRMGFTIRDSIVTDIGEGYVMDDYVMEKVYLYE